ncbi:MAG: hypothetical protein K0R46_1794 [Herbinix sp.]|nr:hypothetical protein [Herbinix sp.]
MIYRNRQISKTSNYRYKKLVERGTMFGASLLLLAIISVVASFNFIYDRQYSSYKVINVVNNTNTNTAKYSNYKIGIVKYSTDGVVTRDKDGKLLWNGSYEMSEPMIDTCGSYAVIAEKEGHDIHIYDEYGEVGAITTLYDIIKVEIASQGVIAVLMEEDNDNYISLYDVDGTVLCDMKTNSSDDGYPLDMSLSGDGKKLVTSYLSFKSDSLVDYISFYNFDKVGQNEVNNLVGGWPLGDSIVAPRVAFINEDTVCIYKDNGFVLCSMKEIPIVIKDVDFEGEIQSILSNDKYIGFVLRANSDNPKQLIIYDLKGRKVLDKPLEFDYKAIYFSNNEVIMYHKKTCVIMKPNGNIKFNYSFDKEIKAFYQSIKPALYYYVDDEKLYMIELDQ